MFSMFSIFVTEIQNEDKDNSTTVASLLRKDVYFLGNGLNTNYWRDTVTRFANRH